MLQAALSATDFMIEESLCQANIAAAKHVQSAMTQLSSKSLRFCTACHESRAAHQSSFLDA